MDILSIDIETYSSVDLIKSGVYAYASAPDFKILLFAYAFNDEAVNIIDIACGEELPQRVKEALTNKIIIKTAYNANFERTCIKTFFNIELPINQWRCSAVAAAELGLPQTLDKVAKVLGLEQQKDNRGKALIKYFCVPCKPTIANSSRTINLPEHSPEKWKIFKEYCKQDVEVERAIRNKLSLFAVNNNEQKLWEFDQTINDRGVNIDLPLIKNAIKYNNIFKNTCIEKLEKLTGIKNVNSVIQLKKWIFEETGIKLESLDKKALNEALSNTDNLKLKEVLKLRAYMAKTSVSKYEAMLRSVCTDGRIRGLLKFYGANRTGRWAGRIVQVQNLPKNNLNDLKLANELVKNGDYELFEMLFDNVPQILSELIRTAFIPSKGRIFIVSDFSAIEARVLAYVADEKWRMEVFKNNSDIYCESASQMFKVPVKKHGINGHLRQKGKIAELALGYGGSVAALISMGALEMGLCENELPDIVKAWRNANTNIKKFWHTVEKAAIDAVNDRPSTIKHGISFIKKSGILFIGLPSGRRIAYVRPRIEQNRFGGQAITYEGVQDKNWQRLDTYGGKLVENIVQAIARDCLAESIIRLENMGFEINFHVHDEVIIDVAKGTASAKEISDIMSEPISWAPNLVLNAEAYETEFYKKD